MKTNIEKTIDNKDIQEQWFDDIISELKKDQLLLDTGLLDKKTEEIYNAFINNDVLKVYKLTQDNLHRDLTKLIIFSYLSELKNRTNNVTELAFDYSSKGLLIWAVINDDDEKTEKALILTEAKINNDLADKYNYHISSTIIEKSDNTNIPTQYKKIS